MFLKILDNILYFLIADFIFSGLIIFLRRVNVNFVQIVAEPIIEFKDKIVNMAIIIFTILFYFFIVLFLYLNGIDIWLDLISLIDDVIKIMNSYHWIVVFPLYIYLMAKTVYIFTLCIKIFRDLFKFEVIKRHIYNFRKRVYHGSNFSFKNSYAHQMVRLKLFTIEHLQNKILFYFDRKIRKSSYHIGFRKDLDKITRLIFYKGHYFIFCLFFIYDIITNKGVITHVFPLLLYIFVYDTILKISNFIKNLYLPYDEEIYMFTYETPHVLKEKIIILGNNHKLSTGHLLVLLHIYLRNGLYYDPNKYDYNKLEMYFNTAYTFDPETLDFKPNYQKEADKILFESFYDDEETRKKLFDEIYRLRE